MYIIIIYRRITSDPAKEWLRILKDEDVQVIICLSHADRLYVECIEDHKDDSSGPTEYKKRKIGSHLYVSQSMCYTYSNMKIALVLVLAIAVHVNTVEPPNVDTVGTWRKCPD